MKKKQHDLTPIIFSFFFSRLALEIVALKRANYEKAVKAKDNCVCLLVEI